MRDMMTMATSRLRYDDDGFKSPPNHCLPPSHCLAIPFSPLADPCLQMASSSRSTLSW